MSRKLQYKLFLSSACFYIIYSLILYSSVDALTIYPKKNGGSYGIPLNNPFLLKPYRTDKTSEAWTGRWFPDAPTTSPTTLLQKNQEDSPSGSFLHAYQTSNFKENNSISGFPSAAVGTSRRLVTPSKNQTWWNLLNSLFQNNATTWPGSLTADMAQSQPTDLMQLPSFSNLQYSMLPKLRKDSLMSRHEESWTGRWFPERTTTSLPRLQQSSYKETPVLQTNSMWQMINSSCDDGKTNLTVDWDGSPVNYTCFNPHKYLKPDYDLPNLIIKSPIPKEYKAKHECMNTKIEYRTDLPTFGTHRPAWPRYGEYSFLPRQRWLHSLEHGGVVMLYHPCAHPELVNELKAIVKSCLYRHVITPYTLLPLDRPMALLTWGYALLLTAPDERGVISFIRNHALHGPEATSRDGQFSEGLIDPARVITDVNDSHEISLCPQTLF